MKLISLLLLISLSGYGLLAQEKKPSEINKKESELKLPKEPKEKEEKQDESETKPTNTAPFIGANIGSVWTVDEKKNHLIYSPDSMVQKSKYKKFVFNLKEFKRLGGNTKPDADFTVYYSVIQTDIENSKPDDPNMPSPTNGFTFIINKCKISKVEANTP